MTVKTPKVQVGISSDANKNFVIDASQADNTLKISRGNAGATTQDVLTVSATGVVSGPLLASVGVGQTWATYSRNVDTDYVNNTGRPIVVSITSVSTNPVTASILVVGGVKTAQAGGGGSGWGLNVSSIVPVGATYRLQNVNANIETWAELR